MSAGPVAPEPSVEVVVRPCRAPDAERIRTICFETGFMGEPVGWMWRDRASFAALFCDWWIAHEPGSILVAEADGVASGYLLGCAGGRPLSEDARSFVAHFLGRGCCLRPGTARVMWRMLGDAFLDGVRRQLPVQASEDRWPAHLHINLLPELRRHGTGRLLVSTWLDSLRARDIPGCHLQTTAENTRAVRFFEAMGFERHGAAMPEPGFRTPEGRRLHIQLMVQSLRP